MKIHEFQAKKLLAGYGVTVPEGRVASSSAEAFEIARDFGGVVAVKAQSHAGGRGKGGGIKIAKNPEEAEEFAAAMIGSKLVTPQTGPEGKKVRLVLIERGLDIKNEYYLGMILDRGSRRLVFMASREGGVEIEEVAARSPEAILKERVDPVVGFQPYQARKIAFGLGLPVGKAVQFMSALYRAFIDTDASLVEINPLVETRDGQIVAL